ncbi:HNH endonuclease [Aeromicrobium sp. 179-A 4D2 NHS]|uniref:HNH endonuclease n=1 Tax=Aeromicrobium sp. 179-A 4D2 NHS TaxID=3142375 RepID=UPI0039A2FFDE
MYRVASAKTIAVFTLIGTLLFSMTVGTVIVAFNNGVDSGGIQGWTPLASLTEGTAALWAVLTFAPKVTLVAAAVITVMVLVSFLADHIGGTVKDPQRMYTKDQRRQGADRAEGRCEMESVWWLRCPRPGEHGDHFYPHSLGGATSMANFVWACAKCNIAKSNHVPTIWQKIRLERRRRRYFPEDVPTDVGEKYGAV